METALIEQIHEQFSFDLFESVREANDFTYLEKYRPAGVNAEDFIDQVEKYRVFYPGNNFVTEKQIGEICRKYDLVLGSFLNFTGIIPVKNRLELKLFTLRPEDQVYNDTSIPGRIFQTLIGGTRAGVETAEVYEKSIRLRSGFIPGDMEKPFELLPIGDSFVLVAANNEHDVYRLFVKIDVFGSEWLVDMGLASIADGAVWVSWRKGYVDRGPGRSPVLVDNFEVSLTLPFSVINSATTLNLSANVCPSVVAPGTMFERYKGAVEVLDYRLRFKPGLSPADPTSFIHVDDPIILQPVPFGYLVVTKWGKESNIGEIQNPKTN